MLHEAPLCMGIAHDGAAVSRGPAGGTEYRNVYWAYDGGHQQLVRFDFESDHGPGSMDHSLANVRRYAGLKLGYVAGTTSHMELDASSRELFVADTGNDRVLRVMVDTGHYLQDAKARFPIYSSPEASFNYTIWEGLQWSVLGVLDRPNTLALAKDVVYVGSDTLGKIFAFDRATGVVLKSVTVVSAPERLRGISLSHGALYLARSHPSGGGKVATLRVDAAATCTGSSAQSAGCHDGVKGAGEADVDCGGALCARCALGKTCAEDNDCASGRCGSGVCVASASDHGTTAEFLFTYLDSEWHRESFAHHMLNGEMGGASYLNPYPIMEDSFCDTVGVNASTGILSCSRIDYDSLLLGGCWCHPCLPVNPCRNGGTCVNYEKKGYTCNCTTATGFEGDHCHVPISPPSPPPSRPSPPSPPLPPLPPSPPPMPLSMPACSVSTYWHSTTLPDGYAPGSFDFVVTGHTEDTQVECVISSSVGSTCCSGGGGWTFPTGRTEPKGGSPTSEPAAGDTVTCTAQGGGCTGQSGTCTYKGGGSAECIASSPPPSLPPPPSPPPPSPPSTPPPSTATVVLTFTASGSVSDYSDTSSLQQKIATAAGVDKSLVTIRVTAASVRITATIAVPASMTADKVQTSLSSSLGTIDDASAALGVTVEEVPTVALSSPPVAPPSEVNGSSGGTDSALIIGLVLGGVALLALAGTAAFMYRGSASRARARATAPAAAPVKPAATALDASLSPVIASTPDAKSAIA